MKSAILFALTTLSSLALAASGGHGDPNHIPWTLILTQIFNLTLVVGFLVVKLKGPIRNFFTERRAKYEENVQRAEKFANEARQKNQEIRDRLHHLEADQGTQLKRAQTEAAELRTRLGTEAQTLAKRLVTDAQQMALFEKEKAAEELRLEVLNAATEQAQNLLKTNSKMIDQKRLQSEFVQKIQVMQ